MSEDVCNRIAVVGMGCRFPGGANDPEAFWKLLQDGVDAIVEVPRDRYNVDEFYDPDLSSTRTMNTRWGGFVEGVDEFDAAFFGISAREACSIDPQQRLLLEVTWNALENAGLAPDAVAGSATGVYIGICSFDYASVHLEAPPRAGTGVSLSIAANRLSYFYDFHGPSMAVDTACSSSLVALDLACHGLRNGDADTAVVGAVNALIYPYWTVGLSQAGFMAPDGRCKTFDASANGYVRGEGCGVVILKRLSDAIDGGHDILGVIYGSAVNHGGRSNGLTAPNERAQLSANRQALRKAGVLPHQISYVEAHGTGTSLGDVAEVHSVWAAIAEGRGPHDVCTIGSVKSNIGHLEAASGLAGLIKLLLALKHEEIPAQLHFKEINPNLNLDPRLRIATDRTPWRRTGVPRFAGLSSFGAGGTNAHVIVGEAPQRAAVQPGVERPMHLLTLSGRTPKALAELARRYSAHIAAHPSQLPDVCYTANAGRSHFEYRLAAGAASAAEMQEHLNTFAVTSSAGRALWHGVSKARKDARIAFRFSGDGSHERGIGGYLYATQPTFRRIVDQCDERFPHASFVTEGRANAGTALFVLEYALAQLWKSWGIVPSAVIGDGVGELAAACVAGTLGWEDALQLASQRDTTSTEGPRSVPDGFDFCVEIGPANADWETLLSSLATLYAGGVQVDWRGFDRDYGRHLVVLPTYPFERKRYWIDPWEMRSCPGPLQKVEV
jgi:acyl transferase domain-containing protein